MVSAASRIALDAFISRLAILIPAKRSGRLLALAGQDSPTEPANSVIQSLVFR